MFAHHLAFSVTQARLLESSTPFSGLAKANPQVLYNITTSLIITGKPRYNIIEYTCTPLYRTNIDTPIVAVNSTPISQSTEVHFWREVVDKLARNERCRAARSSKRPYET